MAAVEARYGDDVHKRKDNRQERRYLPERVPVPLVGEKVAECAETAKALCAFLGKYKFERRYIAAQTVGADFPAARD